MYRKGDIVMVKFKGKCMGFSIIRILSAKKKSNAIEYTYKRIGCGKGGHSIDRDKLKNADAICKSNLDNTDFFIFSVIDEREAVLEVL